MKCNTDIHTSEHFVYTVKRVDEVVRHMHRVIQDQFSLVLVNFVGIPEDNFTINIELFRQNFTLSKFCKKQEKSPSFVAITFYEAYVEFSNNMMYNVFTYGTR